MPIWKFVGLQQFIRKSGDNEVYALCCVAVGDIWVIGLHVWNHKMFSCMCVIANGPWKNGWYRPDSCFFLLWNKQRKGEGENEQEHGMKKQKHFRRCIACYSKGECVFAWALAIIGVIENGGIVDIILILVTCFCIARVTACAGREKGAKKVSGTFFSPPGEWVSHTECTQTGIQRQYAQARSCFLFFPLSFTLPNPLPTHTSGNRSQ